MEYLATLCLFSTLLLPVKTYFEHKIIFNMFEIISLYNLIFIIIY